MTAGVIIGAFEGDNIRTHHKQFLKMAIILPQLIAEFPQQNRSYPKRMGEVLIQDNHDDYRSIY